ncbi:MAG: hypothetical protein NTW49_10725 [Bacteroidia bacterium]|nr:hypothetical protein [Bacteroidia bacterium]
MRTLFTILLFLFIAEIIHGQDISVEVKGVGITRDQALQDAFKTAVSQALGTYVQAETQVENFTTIKDAIITKSTGYISKYEITKEVPLSKTYEITIKAEVSTAPLKLDVSVLTQFIGGLRFLVLYDSRGLSKKKITACEFITERINEALSSRKIRYIEKSRFIQVREEAIKTLINDTSEVSFVQKLGLLTDAEFIILIKNVQIRSEKKNDVWSVKAIFDANAYDNCTAEGLGTVNMEGSFKMNPDQEAAVRLATGDAVSQGFENLMTQFNRYLGEWISNGAPYQLKFYKMGTPGILRGLITKLQSDPDFGGQMSDPDMTGDLIKLNMTFRKRPFELYNKILDYTNEIPELKAKDIDAGIMYGRQLSFAPKNMEIPDAIEKDKLGNQPFKK